MNYNRMTRRHFLQGAGGALLLPFLPSLFSEKAAAQVMSNTQKNFIGMAAFNGLFRMYGPTSILMPATNPVNNTLSGFAAQDLPGKHRIHSKLLSDIANANNGRISDLIDTSFSPYLGKMNMLQGLDYLALGWRHHHGQFGNMADSFSGPNGMPAMASIEQVMAFSSTFYKNPALIGKAVAYNANSAERGNYGASHTWANPASKATSEIVYTSPYSNPATLWDSFFKTQTATTPTNVKATLVDQVLNDYKNLRASSRLGAEDKVKLDQHIALLYETQKKVTAVGAVCNFLRPSSSLADRKLILQTLNSVIVALISCGYCHSFLGWANSLLSANPEDWHTWSHASYSSESDAIGNAADYNNLVEQNRSTLKDMFLDLVTKLDQAGHLNNSVVVWSQEHSKRGHEAWNVPVIMAGSAGGVFKTGQYIDYRNLNSGDDLTYTRLGFPITQLLGNILQAVDVLPAEYESYNKTDFSNSIFAAKSGYGHSKFDPDGFEGKAGGHYKTWAGHSLSSWLPLIKA